jgi:hypothetical protein
MPSNNLNNSTMNGSLISLEAKTLFDSYPEAIKQHLYRLFNSVLDILDLNNTVSILFIGSGSRGELSYKILDDEIDIFSDYEFVIVVERQLSDSTFNELNSLFSKLEKEWNIKSPLFYIDYGVSTYLKFKNTPPTLWAYEAKMLGVVVFGKDVKRDLKDVGIKNIDFGNLNELVIVRLWNMLVHMNDGFIKNTNTKYENFIIKFYYARNILDILTILLPQYNVLKGGYKNRTNYFVKNFHTPEWKIYKDDFLKATMLKIELRDDLTLEHAQDIFYNGYLNLISDISSLECLNNIDLLESKKKNLIKRKVFKEKLIRSLRRRYIEFKLFREYYKYSLKSLALFSNDGLRINLLFLLLFMHKSLSISLDDNDKILFLRKAIRYFNKISFQNKFLYDDSVSFDDNIIKLRHRLLDFMMVWLYGRSSVKKEQIIKYMKWREK